MNSDRPTSKAPALPAHGSASPDERRSHGTFNSNGDEWPMLAAAHRENSSSTSTSTSTSTSSNNNNNNNNRSPPAFASTPPFSSAMPSDYHRYAADTTDTDGAYLLGIAPAEMYMEDYEMINDEEGGEEDNDEDENEQRTLLHNLTDGRIEGQYGGYSEDLDDDDDDLRSEDIPSSYIPSSSEDDDPVVCRNDGGRSGGNSIKRGGGISSTGGSSPVTRSGSMDVQPSNSRMRDDDSESEADPGMFETEILSASSLTLQELQSSSEDQHLPTYDNVNREASGSCNPSRGLPDFTLPTTFRIMYLGQATEQDKQIMSKKVSESLAEAFSENPSFFSSPPPAPALASSLPVPQTGTQRLSNATAVSRHRASPRPDHKGAFKEKKHHILLLSLLPSSADGDATIDTCEDNGLSIIEADFTGDNLKMSEDYINRQLSDKKSTHGSKHPADDGFGGFVYPDETPNGIDLVIYFFAGDVIRELGASYQSDPEEEERIEDDMLLLWRLSKLDVPILVALSSVTTRKGVRVTDEHEDDAIFYTDTMVYPEDVRDDTLVPNGEVGEPVVQSATTTNPFIFSSPTPTPSLSLSGSARLANRRNEVIDLLIRYKVQCFNFTNPALERPSTTGEPNTDHLWNWNTPCPGRPANLVDHQVYTVPELVNMNKRSVYCDLRYVRGLGVRAERIRAEARRKNEEQNVAKRETLRKWICVLGIPAGTTIFAIIMLYLGMIIATSGTSGQWLQRGVTRHRDNEIHMPAADMGIRWSGDTDWAAQPTSLMENLRQRETQQRETQQRETQQRETQQRGTQERDTSEQSSQPMILGKIEPGWKILNAKSKHTIIVSTYERDSTPRTTGGEALKVVVSGGKQGGTNLRVVDRGDGKYIVHVDPIVHAGAEITIWLAGIQIEGSPVLVPKPFREIIAVKTRQLVTVTSEMRSETKEPSKVVTTDGEEKKKEEAKEKKKKTESTVAVMMKTTSPATKETAEAKATVMPVMAEIVVHKAADYWEKFAHELEWAYVTVREEAIRGWDRVRVTTGDKKTEGNVAERLREARNRALEKVRLVTTRARARSVKIVKNVKAWVEVMQGLAVEWAQEVYGVVVETIGWE
ncbi:hypothetical protein BC937DRAFT_91875 [Endogone sp. FLAS-F59071]|nr:hypothetical protein BC937DRAFT_91875 [Endogone sp. FLAS-F59071]|eukprot:RUS15870.1 hypothetical protein BC937DRAFT_91875 [Endogone sp. FLAS-F59071]